RQLAVGRQLTVVAENLLRERLEALVRFAPADLQNRPLRSGRAFLHDVADGAQVIQPQDFVLDIGLGDLLAGNTRVHTRFATRVQTFPDFHEPIELTPRL